jgi:hypothetical protein
MSAEFRQWLAESIIPPMDQAAAAGMPASGVMTQTILLGVGLRVGHRLLPNPRTAVKKVGDHAVFSATGTVASSLGVWVRWIRKYFFSLTTNENYRQNFLTETGLLRDVEQAFYPTLL